MWLLQIRCCERGCNSWPSCLFSNTSNWPRSFLPHAFIASSPSRKASPHIFSWFSLTLCSSLCRMLPPRRSLPWQPHVKLCLPGLMSVISLWFIFLQSTCQYLALYYVLCLFIACLPLSTNITSKKADFVSSYNVLSLMPRIIPGNE